MTVLYNEIEPYAADWIENLARAGHIANGTVDRRSIVDLATADVAGPGQRHFFAGIGAWSYALRIAGWPDDIDTWTGSCPCQPFSSAGRGLGFADERHLWPAWFRLIRECRPAVVFGEQSASPAGLAWLDLVQADLEGAGYAVGAADLCAAGVGAPHIRQRLYFVAVAAGELRHGGGVPARPQRQHLPDADRSCASGVGLADAASLGRREGILDERLVRSSGEGGSPASDGGGLGHADGKGVGRNPRAAPCEQGAVELEGEQHRRVGDGPIAAGEAGPWSRVDWIYCRDHKHRPIEPGTQPLAHGVASRVGKLRAFGNAIVPQVAATFVRAVMDTYEIKRTP